MSELTCFQAVDLVRRRPWLMEEEYPNVTILFADIYDFWKVAGSLPPASFIDLLNRVFSLFDRLADKHGVQKIKTIGDSYMAVAGLPTPRPDHAEAVAELALSMQREVASLHAGARQFSVRIGIHSGAVVAGVVGIHKLAYDLWGPRVNLANQMENCGVPGAIQVSQATHMLLKDKYLFEPRGEFYVKGKRVELEKEQVKIVYQVDLSPFDRRPERGGLEHRTTRENAAVRAPHRYSVRPGANLFYCRAPSIRA